ncbi:MAG: DAK2 domain-containing protein [Ktedonobacterales bacterium]|nr:MAG: DAK2 domain-containing protein [Ktedonobacterales bacterium]
MAGHAWLEQHREAINALNVFPVPDGDTGTNMSLTMRAATKEIANSDETAAYIIAEKLSRGALMGARGNSGVILSQILRGMSQGLDQKTTFTAKDLAAALQSSAKLAYRAVIKPVEGTILTVIRECSEASVASAERGSDIAIMLGDTVAAAKAAVAKTPDLLPTLKQAGVVDAGGQGLTMFLEGMWRYARGESLEVSQKAQVDEFAEVHKGNVTIEEEFGYEVVFLLHGEDLNLEEIRDTITAMGGVSTVVAGDNKLLKVHTHTPTPGKILDYGVGLGSLQDINIENLQEQSLRYAAESARERGVVASVNGAHMGSGAATSATAVAEPPSMLTPAEPLSEIGTVAVAAGPGWVQVFESLNVSRIVPGGQTMNPSTQDLLEAVEACPAEKIIILPNNGNVIMSARQVEQLTKKQICVIPTKSMPQGIGALLSFNYDADFATNCATMEHAVQNVQTAEITRAVRTVQIDGINVTEGDIIGLVNDRLVHAGTEMNAVVHDTLARMQAEKYEIITVYYGADVTAEMAEQMAQRIKEQFPAQEIEVVEGGQPFYAYIISAE